MLNKRNQKELLKHYYDYILAETPPEEVENIFQQIEYLKQNKNLSDEKASEIIFKKYASPNYIPCDAWLGLEEDEDEIADNEDEFYEGKRNVFYDNSVDDDDDDDVDDDINEHKTADKGTKFSLYIKTTPIGASLELWPFKKFLESAPTKAEYIINNDFPNYTKIVSTEEFQDKIKNSKYIYVNKITDRSIKKLIPEETDAIVMDPPFDMDFDSSDLKKIFKTLKTLNVFFVFIWVDPENMQKLNDIANETDFMFCDSCVVELFDNLYNPVNYSGELGLLRHSRMIFIYKTKYVRRNKFAQQRSKDVGFGISMPKGKSRGRPSMPQVAHEIIEKMLPSIRTKSRIFVELWPSRMSPRSGWIFIDEKC